MKIEITLRSFTNDTLAPAHLLRELAEMILESKDAELNRKFNQWTAEVTDASIQVIEE